jgi:hypothetical protein
MEQAGIPGGDALRKLTEESFRAEYECDRSRLWLDWTLSGVVLTTVQGPGVVALAPAIVECWAMAQRNAHRVRLLIDFSQMPVYDGAYRTKLTAWAVRFRANLECIEVYSRSKLVNMGAAIASLAIGGNLLRTYDQAEPFDRLVRDAGLRSRGR